MKSKNHKSAPRSGSARDGKNGSGRRRVEQVAVTRERRPRYTVGSSKLRGESRIYYAVDNDAPQWAYPNSRYASPGFTRRKSAERACALLNAKGGAARNAELTEWLADSPSVQ